MSTSGPSKIVAVGDVHGELDALQEILCHAGILGDQGQWVGGSTIVVQTGDVIDRGPDSVGVYKLLKKLQLEAPRTGGAVVRLLGNHELALLEEENCMTDVSDWRNFRRMLEHDVLAGKVRGVHMPGRDISSPMPAYAARYGSISWKASGSAKVKTSHRFSRTRSTVSLLRP